LFIFIFLFIRKLIKYTNNICGIKSNNIFIFAPESVDIAGKTGTAQESKTRGNHAFFISFAPYESPEIAVTVNIPYGYSSTNAAVIAKNIYKYYYNQISLDYILNNSALDVSDVKIGD